MSKHTEAQEKAIRSKKDRAEEDGEYDKEGGKKCKKCGKAIKEGKDCPCGE